MLLLSYYVVNLILLWKLKILYTTPTAAEVTALQLNYHFCASEINFCRFLIQSVCLNFEMNIIIIIIQIRSPSRYSSTAHARTFGWGWVAAAS